MVPKPQHLPSPARETDKEQKRREEVFFPPKKSQTTDLFGSIGQYYWLEDAKNTQQNEFDKKNGVRHKNKDKIRKFVLERTKCCLKKKEQNQKQTVFVWTLFLFVDQRCLLLISIQWHVN